MFEFLLRLRTQGISTYASDYRRMRIALSTGGKWTISRLREVLRVLLVRDVEQEEIFDRCFAECFGNDTKGVNKKIVVSKILAELQSIVNLTEPEPVQETPIFPDRTSQPMGKNQSFFVKPVQETSIPLVQTLQPVSKKRRVFLNIGKLQYWLILLLVVGVALFLVLRRQSLSNILSIVQQSWPVILLVLLSVVLMIMKRKLFALVWKRFRELTMSKPRLRSLSDFIGQREFILKVPLEPLCSNEFLDEFADNLGYFLSEENDELLDVGESVEKTCKQGIAELIFERKRKTRHVLILTDLGVHNLPIYDLPKELAVGLEQRGIPVKYGYFYDSPEHFKIFNDKEYELADLDDDRDGYLVLIFSDGHGVHRDQHRLLLEDMSHWPLLAWMETRSTNKWDNTTELISSYVPVYSATLNGLQQVSDLIRSERPKNATLNISVNHHHTLENELSDSLPWACACALMQPMHWGMAEKLRRHFFNNLPKENIQLLLDLSGTRSTNAGFRFSKKVTKELLSTLRSRWPEQETVWRDYLDSILETHQPAENSAAHLTWQHCKAINLLQIDEKSARLGAEMLLDLRNCPVEKYNTENLHQLILISEDDAKILLRPINRDKWTQKALKILTPQTGESPATLGVKKFYTDELPESSEDFKEAPIRERTNPVTLPDASQKQVILLAQKLKDVKDLTLLADIVTQLPEGEEGFLVQTSRLREMVGEIAKIQMQLNTVDDPVLRGPIAKMLRERIENFRNQVADFSEPLASEFRQAAIQLLEIAKKQVHEAQAISTKEPNAVRFGRAKKKKSLLRLHGNFRSEGYLLSRQANRAAVNLKYVIFMRAGRIEFSYGVKNGYFFVHKLLNSIRKFANKYSLLRKSAFYRLLKILIKKVKEKLYIDDYENLEYSQLMRFLLHEIDAPLSKRDNRIRIESIPKKTDVIYCSSTKRSIETAKLIQEHLKRLGYEPPRIAYDLQEELAEVKFTKDILTLQEFKMNGGLIGCRTSILRKWYYGQNLAETFQDSIKRAERLWQFLERNRETNIILVTHGWYLLLLRMYFTGERNNFTNLRNKDIILKYGQSFRIHLSNGFQPHTSFTHRLSGEGVSGATPIKNISSLPGF